MYQAGSMKAGVNPASFMSGINQLMHMRASQAEKGVSNFGGIGEGVRAKAVAEAQQGGRFEGLSPEEYQNAYAQLTGGQSMSKGAMVNNQNLLKGKQDIQGNEWDMSEATTLFDRQMAKQHDAQGFSQAQQGRSQAFSRAQQGRSQAFSREQSKVRNDMMQGSPEEQANRANVMETYYAEKDPDKKMEILGRAISSGALQRKTVQSLSDLGVIPKQYRKNGGSSNSPSGNSNSKYEHKDAMKNFTPDQRQMLSDAGGGVKVVKDKGIYGKNGKLIEPTYSVRYKTNNGYRDVSMAEFEKMESERKKFQTKQIKANDFKQKADIATKNASHKNLFAPKNSVEAMNKVEATKQNKIKELNKLRMTGKLSPQQFMIEYRKLNK